MKPIVVAALVLACALPAAAQSTVLRSGPAVFVDGYSLPRTLGTYFLAEQPGKHWVHLQQVLQNPDRSFYPNPHGQSPLNDTEEFVVVDAHFGGAHAQELERRYAIGYVRYVNVSCLYAIERKDLTTRKPRARARGPVLDTQKTDRKNRELLQRMGRP